MDLKEEEDGVEGRKSSSLRVWQYTVEALRAANGYLGSSSGSQSPEWTGYSGSPSEVGSFRHRRNSSFQNLKSSISRVWRWGGNSQYENGRFYFDPEELADQKRQWYQLRTPDRTKYQDPTALFEHFIVTGLPRDANLEAVEAAFARRKKWELETSRSDVDGRSLYYHGPSQPSLEPQMIFKYPAGKKLPMRLKDLCSFTFPGGVKAKLLEKTPSLSDLNSLVYGQEHLRRDDLAFIFSLKAADHGTLYGVCLQVPEIVQRPLSILGYSSPLSNPTTGCGRFLVSAPRCYCLLTRVPFFQLHYDMLNSMMAQERLNRITQFVSDMSISDSSLLASREDQSPASCDSPNWEEEWMSTAIRIENVVALSAAAAGIITDDEVASSSKSVETLSPLSRDGSEESEFRHAPDVSENRAIDFERAYENSENGSCSPEPPPSLCISDCRLERSGSYVSVRSLDDEDDDLFSCQESDHSSDSLHIECAKETKNDLLQIVCAYGSAPIPARGSEIVFQPLKHLQPIRYKRPSASDLGIDESSLDAEKDPFKTAEICARLATIEEAVSSSVWTTATICRILSLDSVLALLSGILLEKQVVVFCPNLGVLSAVMLSITPMIRPFEWQSLFLPILPLKMLDFLDAPVPYILGMQNRPTDLRTSNLVLVDVVKDQVKTCSLPQLPRYKELYNELRPIHATLASQFRIAAKHPVYRCSDIQIVAVRRFLSIIKRYMESLCADLQFYSITSVQSNDDRVSLLLKDSFIDSFPSRDRSFIKLFIDTQMFSVLSDSRLASFEEKS